MKDRLANNIESVRGRIAEACARASRNYSDVTLVAVTKYIGSDIALLLPVAGVFDLGENRVQALVSKSAEVQSSVRWHMIGHLQRNKAKKAVQHSVLIHSVDSVRLIEALDACGTVGNPVKILLEVNVSGEGSKLGFDSDSVNSAVEFAMSCKCIELHGLMTMAPIVPDPGDTRPFFATLRNLHDSLKSKWRLPESFAHLSMGMSSDFEVAVEEGATLVRIGSLLYEGVL